VTRENLSSHIFQEMGYVGHLTAGIQRKIIFGNLDTSRLI